MNDIGDDVTITTTVRVGDALTDPASVTLEVVSPSGTSTNPTVTNPSTGFYEAIATATEAGRWRYTWTTDSPDGVEHGYFDVTADPPRPDPLATPADLEDRLGRALSDTEAARAPALLRDASAKVRAYCRQVFDLTTGDTVTLRPIGTKLKLPQRPVRAVSSVVAVSGRDDIPDVTLTGWAWDGLDEVEIGSIGWRTSIDWDLEPALTGWAPDTYQVTYDHGHTTTPDDVVEVVCSMVNRVLLAPSPVEGMSSEQVGQYRYQLGAGASSVGARVRLTQDDKDTLADAGYRRRSGTIQMRL